MRRGINANPIIYPAVPEDKARLRFFVTSCHSEDQIRYTVKALAEELKILTETLKARKGCGCSASITLAVAG